MAESERRDARAGVRGASVLLSGQASAGQKLGEVGCTIPLRATTPSFNLTPNVNDNFWIGERFARGYVSRIMFSDHALEIILLLSVTTASNLVLTVSLVTKQGAVCNSRGCRKEPGEG